MSLIAFLVTVTVPFPELLYTYVLFTPDLNVGSVYNIAPLYAFIVGSVLSILEICKLFVTLFPAISVASA